MAAGLQISRTVDPVTEELKPAGAFGRDAQGSRTDDQRHLVRRQARTNRDGRILSGREAFVRRSRLHPGVDVRGALTTLTVGLRMVRNERSG